MNARLSLLLLVVLAPALGLGGCTDVRVPVQFYGLCGFPDALTCDPPAGKCVKYQNGQLYLHYQSRDSLDMVAEFHNQRPNNADTDSGAVNTADAMITEYRYTFSASPPVRLAPLSLPYMTTPIGPGGTATVWVPVIPISTVAELRATAGYQGYISVEITARGQFGDGSTFEAKGITIPVWVIASAPAPYTCPDPAVTPTFCPSEYQTHSVSCGSAGAAGTFVLGGTITGLTGNGLVLATPGFPNLTVTAGSTSFAFPSNLSDGAAYDITIQTQPAGQTCTINGGTGTVAGGAPAGITITCI